MRTHFKIKVLSFVGIFILTFSFKYAAYATSPTFLTEYSKIESYTEYKGSIVDKKTGLALTFANITVIGTNISCISNSEGEFSLKVSKKLPEAKVLISYIGYKSRQISLEKLSNENLKIELELTSIKLPEINVTYKDAEALMRAVLERKGTNYFNNPLLMIAFYREAIKKNRTFVSVSEAVVEINKQPINSNRSDILKLNKARRSTDYSKLDTITFKLQGGPFNSIYLDIMKYPELIFTNDIFSNYQFGFDKSTYINNHQIFIIDFKQRETTKAPLYYGKLYIDAQSLAVKSAVFKLNISDRYKAASMFLVKKPFNARIYPIEADYRIDYLEKNGKWYYGYSRIDLGLRINWKKKLFNTSYYSTIELAVTDWEYLLDNHIDRKERLRPTVIINDKATDFSDPYYWGEYNVIEPENTIESAIKKIQKQLNKD